MILLEPILSKIPEKIHSPRRPPPRTAACLAEKFSLLFYFAPARFFLLKGKEKLFVDVLEIIRKEDGHNF
jgi:streptomycin 6-kinase